MVYGLSAAAASIATVVLEVMPWSRPTPYTTPAQADAVHAPILRVHLRGLLVAMLVGAVQRGQRAVSFHGAVRCDRAGVADALDAELACGFEARSPCRPRSPSAGHRIGLAERHLQRGQMDDCARTAGLRGLQYASESEMSPVNHSTFWRARLGHQQSRPPLVVRQVEGCCGDAGAGEQRQRPAADASAGAGDQHGAVELGLVDWKYSNMLLLPFDRKPGVGRRYGSGAGLHWQRTDRPPTR